jgi:hypothetical protein
LENPDVVLEMAIESGIVGKDGKKTDKCIFSYKNLSRDNDAGDSAMEFGTMMCSLFNNKDAGDDNGKEN